MHPLIYIVLFTMLNAHSLRTHIHMLHTTEVHFSDYALFDIMFLDISDINKSLVLDLVPSEELLPPSCSSQPRSAEVG